MSLPVGASVDLLLGQKLVGRGEVFKIDRGDLCHGVELGDSRVSVKVISCSSNVEIPFPHGDIHTLCDVIGGFALWRRSDLAAIASNGSSYAPLPSQQESPPNNASLPGADFSIQKNWISQKVVLLDPDNHDKKLAEGVINFSHPQYRVKGKALGDDCVGITILNMLALDDHSAMTQYFLSYNSGIPLLVAWNIAHVLVQSEGLLISQMFSGHEDIKPGTQSSRVGLRKKRYYNFSKRKRHDPEEKRKKQFAKKCKKLIEDEAILSSTRLECCIDDCCRKAENYITNVRLEREHYWSMSPANRETMILEKFGSRQATLINGGKMVFSTHVVCKKGFYQLYGFGKTLFFYYQKRYESGSKVGFHWGKDNPHPSKAVLQCISYTHKVLQSLAEPLPHLAYNGTNGTDNLIYKLPSCYNKEALYKEVISLMEAHQIKTVCLNTFYKIWREKFENYSIYQLSAFAKCATCLSLKDRLSKERREDARELLFGEHDEHLNASLSRKSEYYSNRTAASVEPHKFLSIIHDKMDQAKTGIPKLIDLNKLFATGCSPLPFALTGMLIHGMKVGAYGHFSLNGLWPSDPNFTVTSLAKCLRDLEEWDGDRSGDLSIPFRDLQSSSLLTALMDPNAFITRYLEPSQLSIDHFCDNEQRQEEDYLDVGSFRPLPRNLLLQLDNSGKDNKNIHVLAFCSQLVARGVFETIQTSFLMVGHTHEDVDALFGRVASKLRQKEVQTIQELMVSFWNSEDFHPVPSLIQEVANYKTFLKGCLKPMQGHSAPISFLFSMQNNIPVFQYKEHIIGPWLPVGGRPMWIMDEATKKLKIPLGQPKRSKMSNMLRKRPEVMTFIQRFIDWKAKNAQDVTSKAFTVLEPLKSYWQTIFNILEKEFKTRSELLSDVGKDDDLLQEQIAEELQGGFWPKTNHGTGYKEESMEKTSNHIHHLQQEQREEELVAEAMFVGDLAERPPMRFVPLKHVQENEFVIIRPAHDFELLNPKCIWLGRALSSIDIVENSPHNGKFKIEWWRPENKSVQGVPDKIRYKNCLIPSRYWEKDPNYFDPTSPEYIEGSSTIYSWTPKRSLPKLRLMLPRLAQDVIKEHFARV